MLNKSNINKEYEARVMVSEDQYLEIRKKYLTSKNPKRELINVNHYYDTEDRYLTHHHMVLRVREINEKEYELTLKIKGEECDLELNHSLTYEESQNINIITAPEIIKELRARNVDISSLKLVSTLKTERLEIEYEDYLLVIDKNYYNNKVDFNIEVESDSKKAAKCHLIVIISKFGIEYNEDYISKSRRAILGL